MKKHLSIIFSLLLVLCISLRVNANNSLITDKDDNLSYIIEFEDGGKDYVYIIYGVENHCLVPPEGFNPLTASDEDLKKYCFPPRPTDKSELQNWKNNLKHYKSTPTPKLQYKIKTNALDEYSTCNNVLSSKSSYTARTSRIWSGYESVISPTSTNTYSQVQMNYTQPTIYSSTANYYNVYWIGIGGRNTGNLVQAGTATNPTNGHFAWYEYLSETATTVPVQIIPSLTINAGDSIHTYISFEKENNKFTYYIANNTTGKSYSGHVFLDADDYYDGSSVEWIVERASNGYTPYRLGDYNQITLSSCSYKTLNNPSWYAYTVGTNLTSVTMTSNGTSSGTILSQPGSPFGGSCFTCTWHNYE